MEPAVIANSDVQDLDSVEQIEKMVKLFYGDVAQDTLLGPIFNDVAGVDWPEHLPKLTLFWCRDLLGIEGYTGDPFEKHSQIHSKSPFTLAAFERWLDLFHENLNAQWTGPNTIRAKKLVQAVARVHSGQLLDQPLMYQEASAPRVDSKDL